MEVMTLLKIIFTVLLCIPLVLVFYILLNKLIDQHIKKNQMDKHNKNQIDKNIKKK